jgi:hypothetical protein
LWAQFADDNKPLVFPLPADDVDDMEHEDNESQFEISLCLTDKNYADSTFSNNSI